MLDRAGRVGGQQVVQAEFRPLPPGEGRGERRTMTGSASSTSVSFRAANERPDQRNAGRPVERANRVIDPAEANDRAPPTP